MTPTILPQELWQVTVDDRFYEANFDEMIQWINEGAILPEDMVKHGNLRWLEARKVPALRKYFYDFEMSREIAPPEKVKEIYTQFQVDETESVENNLKPSSRISRYLSEPPKTSGEIGVVEIDTSETNETDDKVCSRHPESEPYYYCGICSHYFCKKCPNSFGSIKLCPLCGGLCELYNGKNEIHFTHGAINKPYKRVNSNVEIAPIPVEQGLTLKDLLIAFKFPLQFPSSFLAGIFLFSILGIGISVLSTGDSIMYFIGGLSLILLIMLQFGEFSKTLENLTQRDIHTSYMPHLSRYSFIEDFAHPLLLGFTVYIVSFSLFAVIAGSSLALVNFQFSNQLDLAESEIRKQNDELNSMILKDKVGKEMVNQSETQENVKQVNIEELISQSRENQQNSVFGNHYLGDNGGLTKLFNSFNRLSIYLQMPLCFSFILGILYFPIACAIAGSTRSITKILNPFLGWKTVKKFGFDYMKILCLVLIVASISIGLSAGVFFNFSFLEHPILGIFLTVAVGSILSTYFWLVYSEFLGILVSNKLIDKY